MIVEELRAVAHFRKLSEEALEELARSFERREVGAGEALYEAGDPIEALYVVASGMVVTFRDDAQPGGRPLARLRRGDVVGVADLFDSERRSEAARATENSTLLRGSRSHVLEFLRTQPQVELNLRLAAARDLTARARVKLAIAHRQVVRHRVNREVRLTPAGDPPVAATLIDLSPLGMSFRGAPAGWRCDDIVRYRLSWDDRRLWLVGRIAWREADEVGIELREPTAEQQAELRETLEKMLGHAA